MRGATASAWMALHGVVGAAAMVHSGTPWDVDPATDCAIRELAWEYGQTLMPARGEFRSLFDALQLASCGLARPAEPDAWSPPLSHDTSRAPLAHTLYVAAHSSAPAATAGAPADGSTARPFRALADALASSRGLARPVHILLRSGTHYLPHTIEITPADSGLTIANAPGEEAVVSGGFPLSPAWLPSAACDGCFEALLPGVRAIPGLRRDGVREIRARYPNFDPELDSILDDGSRHMHDGNDGWIRTRTQWVAEGQDMNNVPGPWPPRAPAATHVISAADWPGVEWPMTIDVDGRSPSARRSPPSPPPPPTSPRPRPYLLHYILTQPRRAWQAGAR